MWSVEFSSAAAKSFRKLDGSVQRSVKAKLDELSALIELVILVVDIGKRESVYGS